MMDMLDQADSFTLPEILGIISQTRGKIKTINTTNQQINPYLVEGLRLHPKCPKQKNLPQICLSDIVVLYHNVSQ